MRKILAVIAFIMGGGFTTAAHCVELGRSGADVVFVWKNKDAFGRVVTLAGRDGITAEKFPYVLVETACVVEAGTEAIIMKDMFTSHIVLITSGNSAGCIGMVNKEDLR